MADEHVRSDDAATWDRVGQLLGDMSTVTQNIWRRNLALWSDVSHHLRADAYTADEMAADAARAMAVALNLDPPKHQRTRWYLRRSAGHLRRAGASPNGCRAQETAKGL
jgi:hypothetical protein